MTLLLTLLNKREVATAKFAGTTKLFYSQAMNGDLVYTSGKKNNLSCHFWRHLVNTFFDENVPTPLLFELEVA